MINGKNPPDVGIQLPESKMGMDTVTDSPLDGNVNGKTEVMQVVLRALCLVTSVTALSLMVTAQQASTITVLGFNIPLHSKWSFSHSFEQRRMGRGLRVANQLSHLGILLFIGAVGKSAQIGSHTWSPDAMVPGWHLSCCCTSFNTSATYALHLILQLLISGSRLVRGSPTISSRNHGWLIFAGDEVFALALMSAGSSASSVSSLNHSGIRHTALPNFCKPLHHFCDRVSTSIVFTFFSCFLLAILVVLDVLWLSSKH